MQSWMPQLRWLLLTGGHGGGRDRKGGGGCFPFRKDIQYCIHIFLFFDSPSSPLASPRANRISVKLCGSISSLAQKKLSCGGLKAFIIFFYGWMLMTSPGRMSFSLFTFFWRRPVPARPVPPAGPSSSGPSRSQTPWARQPQFSLR